MGLGKLVNFLILAGACITIGAAGMNYSYTHHPEKAMKAIAGYYDNKSKDNGSNKTAGEKPADENLSVLSAEEKKFLESSEDAMHGYRMAFSAPYERKAIAKSGFERSMEEFRKYHSGLKPADGYKNPLLIRFEFAQNSKGLLFSQLRSLDDNKAYPVHELDGRIACGTSDDTYSTCIALMRQDITSYKRSFIDNLFSSSGTVRSDPAKPDPSKHNPSDNAAANTAADYQPVRQVGR